MIHLDTFGVQAQLRCDGGLIGVRDSGEFLDLAFAGQLVQPLAVAPFAFFDGGGDVDLDEGTIVFDHLADGAPGGGVGRDRRAEGDAAVLGDFRGDIADALDVDVAVFPGKAQL